MVFFRKKGSILNIHIYAPDIFPGDAVGNHCLGVAQLFRRFGFSVCLYAKNYPQDHPEIRTIEELPSLLSFHDLLYVSFSIYDPWLVRILDLPGKKIAYFHGITDPSLLEEWEPETALLCRKGLDQLSYLVKFDQIISNSPFVASGLLPFTSQLPQIVPPIFSDFSIFHQPLMPKKTLGKKKVILVLGRVVPHKKIEDAITILRNIRDKGLEYQMKIVGSLPNSSYSQYLFNHIKKLNLFEVVSFEGQVPENKIYNLYQQSNAYLSMSMHEGFCIPAVEAMHFGLPVFIREGTATQETVGSAGIILENNGGIDHSQKIIDLLESSTKLGILVEKGYQRKQELLSATRDEIWMQILKNLLV